MSSTALEVMMRQAEFAARVREWTEHFDLTPFYRTFWDYLFPRKPIPHTDDMRQMLVDLGIQLESSPCFQPLDLDLPRSSKGQQFNLRGTALASAPSSDAPDFISCQSWKVGYQIVDE